MLFKFTFFIKYYSKVFMIRCSFNLNIVEIDDWMTLKLFFPKNITPSTGLQGSGLKSIF